MKKIWGIFFSFILLNFVSAQKRDSVQTSEKLRFTSQQLYIPGALMMAGSGILLTEKRPKLTTENKNFLAFGGYAEDYLQFAPHAAAFGFEIGGMKPRTDFWNRSAIMIKGELFTFASVTALKYIFKQPRPDRSNSYGFPSGHTANAFAGATLLSVEYQENYPWVPYVSYGLATGVGILRVAHQKHEWSDVVFGAGLGILSMKLAYWTHQYRWNSKKSDKDVFLDIEKRID